MILRSFLDGSNVIVFCFCIAALWNQFDGVAYVYADKNLFTRVWDYYFTRDKTAQYRTNALLCFLPKWRGFLVNEATENMDATEAIVKLDNVVNCLSNVWVNEFRDQRKMQPINFDFRKVICLTVVYNSLEAVVTGGVGYSRIWATWGRAAGQGMVFWPLCPKQGIQFDLPLS